MLVSDTDSYPSLGNIKTAVMLPGINQTYDNSNQAPLITKNEGFWESVQEVGKDFGPWLKEFTKEGYELVRDSAGTVLRDASEGIAGATETLAKPVEGIAGSAVVYTVLVVGALGVALYYIGKTGAFKASFSL